MGQADFCPMGGNIMMQAVIMAGGKGTRLAALTKDEIPKPMVPVAGKPLLLWQVERLKENEITDIIMVIGHLGDKIKEYFGDEKNLVFRSGILRRQSRLEQRDLSII